MHVEVLFGCYDVASQSLLYRKGELLIPEDVGQPLPTQLVEITSVGEDARWSETSGPYGRDGLPEDNAQSCHVSLRVTPNHKMFVQTGPAQGVEGRVRGTEPYRRVRASSLLNDEDDDVGMDEEKEDEMDGKGVDIRLLCRAEGGCTPQSAVGRQRAQRLLSLTDEQFPAFVSLLGFWLGDGSLQYLHNGSGYDAVSFDQVRAGDVRWLDARLTELGLTADDLYRYEYGKEQQILIKKAAWFLFFDEEFGAKYKHSAHNPLYVAPPPKPPAFNLPKTQSAGQPSAAQVAEDAEAGITWTSAQLCSGQRVWYCHQGTQLGRECGACGERLWAKDAKALKSALTRHTEQRHAAMRAAASVKEEEDEPVKEEGDVPMKEEEQSPVKAEEPPVKEEEEENEPLPPMQPPPGYGVSWGPPGRPLQPNRTKSAKHMPQWVLAELSAAEARLLIVGLHLADGSSATGAKTIWTASPSFRDQLMQMLLHCGYSCLSEMVTRANAVRSYNFHDQSKDNRKAYAKAFVEALPAEQQELYVPIKATVDGWQVTWAEGMLTCDTAGKASCAPTMSRRHISRVPYSRAADGRIWCVQVDHPDHLIIAQRAQRNDKGVVTKHSRPLIVGNCECVAWDAVNRRLLPFQTLTTRKRKDVKEDEITVQVALFAFDLLYLNGKSYLGETLRVRREALRAHFTEVEGEFAFAVGKDTGDVEEIGAFLNEAVQSSCEGLMVKALDEQSLYTPGKRSWLKCKKDYLDGVGDTLDLVPIAAFYGKGKRTGHFGAYVLACYDDEAEEFQSICKIGTGFSEEDVAQLAAFYHATADDGSSRTLPSCPRYYKVGDTMKPDVWLAPSQVWEVKCADLSISPVHQAAVGLVDSGKGIALRFPRFMRLRTDKKPEEATTGEQVVDLFRQQNVRAGQQKSKDNDDD